MNYRSQQEALDLLMWNHGIVNMMPNTGSAYWVDGVNGSATNTGKSPDSPLLTIKAALALCTTNNKDTIYILDYPWNTGVTGEDEPIVVSKGWITIAGVGTEEYKEPKVGVNSDEAVFNVQGGHRLTLRNLYIGGGGASHACVEITAYSSNVQIIDCKINTFAPDAAKYGVWVNACAAPNLLVKDTEIGARAQGVIGTDGILISGVTANAAQGTVRNCIFSGITGVGINLSATVGPGFKILDNRFYMPTDADGSAITFADGSSGNFIDGNHAFFGTADPTDPYRDLNGDDDSNAWGLNYKGITATLAKMT